MSDDPILARILHYLEPIDDVTLLLLRSQLLVEQQINAALQNIGHRTIGSGRAVALQSFFENSAMLTSVGIYTAAVGSGARPVGSILVVGVLVLIATTVVSWHLPPDPAVDLPGDDDAAPAAR